MTAKMDERFVDVYITESRSRGVLPMLMLMRGTAAPELDERVAAIFAKAEEDILSPKTDILRYDLDDVETAARLALFLIGRPLCGADGTMFLTM